MAHPHATHLSLRGTTTGTYIRRRSQAVKRRRYLLLGMAGVLLMLATLANYGPLHAYMDARSRLASATEGIAELAAQKSDLQVQLGRLSEAEYLESLARQDLSYTRPGEELYIVTGNDDIGNQTSDSGDSETTAFGDMPQSGFGSAYESPGFMERVLGPILR